MVFNVEKDVEKNRLFIKIDERADKSFIKKTFITVRSMTADLKPGYGVIVDLLKCEIIYRDAIPFYKEMIKHFVATNAGEIVRVIDKESLVYGQLINLTKKIQSYNAVHVPSVEEAEKKLDKNIYRNSLRLEVNHLTARFKHSGEKYNFPVKDISTSGCMILCDDFAVEVGERLDIYLYFKGLEKVKSLFQVKSEVVRKGASFFAVKFLGVDAEFIGSLHDRLSIETCREEPE